MESWRESFGTGSEDVSRDIATDSFDNIYIAGQSGNRGFLIKYNSDGVEQWFKLFHNNDPYSYSNRGFGEGVAVDSYNQVYVSGKTKGDIGGGPRPYFHDSNDTGGYDAFLYKFDSDGNELLRRQLGSSGDDYYVRVATWVDGHLRIAFTCEGRISSSRAGSNVYIISAYDPPPPTETNIVVVTGLNFIGTSVSGSLEGNNIEFVYGYNNASGQFETITINDGKYSLEHDEGYWVKTSSATALTFSYKGDIPTDSSISILPGWNMIGTSLDYIALSSSVSSGTEMYKYDTHLKHSCQSHQVQNYPKTQVIMYIRTIVKRFL